MCAQFYHILLLSWWKIRQFTGSPLAEAFVYNTKQTCQMLSCCIALYFGPCPIPRTADDCIANQPPLNTVQVAWVSVGDAKVRLLSVGRVPYTASKERRPPRETHLHWAKSVMFKTAKNDRDPWSTNQFSKMRRSSKTNRNLGFSPSTLSSPHAPRFLSPATPFPSAPVHLASREVFLLSCAKR